MKKQLMLIFETLTYKSFVFFMKNNGICGKIFRFLCKFCELGVIIISTLRYFKLI